MHFLNWICDALFSIASEMEIPSSTQPCHEYCTILKFKDGEHINLQADCIDIRDGWIMAWRGDTLVVVADANEVNVCYMSEKKGDM